METARIQTGATERIEILLLNSSNVEVTGATVTLKIRRKSDNKFWNGTTFQTGVTTVAMTEINASSEPGKYYYSFDTTGLDEDTYYIIADSASGANVPQAGELKVGGYVDYIDRAISEIRMGRGGFVRSLTTGGGFWTLEEKKDIIEKLKNLSVVSNDIKLSVDQVLALVTAINTAIVTVKESASTDLAAIQAQGESIKQIVMHNALNEEDKRILESHKDFVIEIVKSKNDSLLSSLTELLKTVEGLKEHHKTLNESVEAKVTENTEILQDLFKLTVQNSPAESIEAIVKGAEGGK